MAWLYSYFDQHHKLCNILSRRELIDFGVSDDSYFNNETYRNGTEQVIYNNLTQIYHSISLEFGFKVSEEMALILSGGYRIGGKIGL